MTTTGGGGDASSSELIGVIVFLFIVVAIMFSIGLVVFLIVRKIIERNAQRKTTMTAYAQQRGLAPLRRAQPAVEDAQQHERVERNPLGGHHVVVAQRGVDGPVGGEGVDEASQKSRNED